MKKIRIGVALAVLCALLCGAALAEIPPAPKNAGTSVFDFTGMNLVTEADRQVIDEYAVELERRTGAQAVLVVVNFLDGEEIGLYAHDLLNTWGIGDKRRNDGVLLLLSWGDREWFLYTGTGAERMLNPVACDRILALLRGLDLPLHLPELDQTDALIGGLDDFREHLGGELCITLPTAIGATVEVHNMDAALIREAARVLKSF